MTETTKNERVDLFREVMANYPTGVTVVTTVDHEQMPVGLTVNSFTSLSLDPLLVLWALNDTSDSFAAFSQANKFAVNILASRQAKIGQLFAGKDKDRFKHCEWYLSEYNLPILHGVCATLQCQMYKKISAGDHVIMIGKVLRIDGKGEEPMLYFKRQMGSIPGSFMKR